jgi:hypothetical protein
MVYHAFRLFRMFNVYLQRWEKQNSEMITVLRNVMDAELSSATLTGLKGKSTYSVLVAKELVYSHI